MPDRPSIDPLDRRLNAWNLDLASIELEGKVASKRFVAGEPAHVSAPWCDLRREPSADCGIDSQILLGDNLRIFDRREGWAWIQADRDGYVGWTSDDGLAIDNTETTHIVTVPRTFTYPVPDMKFPALRNLSMGSRIT
ncbi:MAG: peptidase P60, partial [Rhizobiaceae bacterium]